VTSGPTDQRFDKHLLDADSVREMQPFFADAVYVNYLGESGEQGASATALPNMSVLLR
jgi:hypothetical protein